MQTVRWLVVGRCRELGKVNLMNESMWIILLVAVLVPGAWLAREPFMLIVAPLPVAAIWVALAWPLGPVVATLLVASGYLAFCANLGDEARTRGKAGKLRGFKRSTRVSYARPLKPMTVRRFVNPADV